MEWMRSSNIFILILLCKMLPVSSSCPKCPDGRQEGCKCACKKDQYLLQKPTGDYKCEVCTAPCSAAKHLVQITACGNSTNRVCHCAKGYYCTERQNHSCLFACKPCKPGTFSSETSLKNHCKPYTDCKGRDVVTEGTATQDRVCAVAATTTTTTTTTKKAPIYTFGMSSSHESSHTEATEDITKVEHLSTTLDGDSSTVLSITPSESTEDSVYTPSAIDRSSSRGYYLSDAPHTSLTTPPGSPISSTIFNAFTTNKRVTHRSIYTPSKSLISDASQNPESQSNVLTGSSNHPWLTVLLLLLVVSVLVGCFLWLKGKALKKQLKWTRGLPFGRYVTKKEAGGYNIYAPPIQQGQQQPLHDGNPCLERLIPLSTESGAQMRESGSAAQPHPGQGSTQHVTMDNSGRGESISNTVGSIFIYSPGMVVLGTNASERREEMRQEGTEQHLSSRPQQESRSSSSSSYPDSVGLSTQEEDEDKELSYPIPASGK